VLGHIGVTPGKLPSIACTWTSMTGGTFPSVFCASEMVEQIESTAAQHVNRQLHHKYI
jgi:hypothetical protein